MPKTQSQRSIIMRSAGLELENFVSLISVRRPIIFTYISLDYERLRVCMFSLYRQMKAYIEFIFDESFVVFKYSRHTLSDTFFGAEKLCHSGYVCEIS